MATGYGRRWTRCKVITNCLRLIEAWPLMYHVRYSLRHVIWVLVRELRRGETGKEKGNKREFIKRKKERKKRLVIPGRICIFLLLWGWEGHSFSMHINRMIQTIKC